MASLLPSASVSAVRMQSTTTPLRLTSHSVTSVRSCSTSTLCPQTRVSARYPHLQSSQRPVSSSTTLPTRQTRTFLTQLRRQAQALKEQAVTPPAPTKKPSAPKPALQLHNLPYFVRRTGSNQLPVYLVTKAGGTKQLTKIQKTEGDLDALRNDLSRTLGIDAAESRSKTPGVSINRLTGHIIVKGWRKPEILKFLTERNF